MRHSDRALSRPIYHLAAELEFSRQQANHWKWREHEWTERGSLVAAGSALWAHWKWQHRAERIEEHLRRLALRRAA